MICVKSLQLELNRFLLLAVGLWPYEQSKFVRAQVIFLYSILLTCIIFQLTAFVTAGCNSQFDIEVLSTAVFLISFIIIYNTFSFNMSAVKHLLDVIQCTYNELNNDSEVTIIRKYGTVAKRYTYALTIISLIAILIFISLPFWPSTFDLNVLLVNESRSHTSLLTIKEPFVDQKKYFYLSLLHINVALCIGWVAIIAVGTMTITYWLYACGMFQIAGHRVEQAITKKVLKTSDMTKVSLLHKKIIYAIDMHRKALTLVSICITMQFCILRECNEFVNYLLFKIEVSYFLFAQCIVISISLNLYRIFDELSSGINIEKLMSPILFLVTNYVFMFLANYFSQQVKDHNCVFFTAAYNIQWYLAPLPVQGTILFLLQKGTKPLHFNLMGLFVASIEGFTKLTSASISYFTVLHSMKH